MGQRERSRCQHQALRLRELYHHTSGLDLAILNLLDLAPPDIISDSYGLCETITGHTEVALENREAQIATALGVTFFIAQGDTGADECAPVEPTPCSILGINSGDHTASAYAVDVGGTDFMAPYNFDTHGVFPSAGIGRTLTIPTPWRRLAPIFLRSRGMTVAPAS
jgi:subtilase family serine protease